MAFAHITFADLKTEFLSRLSDPGAVFWTDVAGGSEIEGILREAIRTWNAFTNYYRARATLQTSAAGAFYDLPTKLQQAYRTYNVTDRGLALTVIFALMEPGLVGNAWTGSDQFTLNDIQSAMQRRRNQFLLESRSIFTRFTQPTPAPPIGRVTLPDTVIDLERVAWSDLSGNLTPLRQSDESGFMAFSANWNLTPGQVPAEYSVQSTPPLTMQFSPIPVNNGVLDIVAILSGADIAIGAGVPLGIPDDFVWVLKYGILADLLGKEGQAKDSSRAQYCEMRWREGIELARISSGILVDSLPVYCNGVQMDTATLDDFDSYDPLWQNSRDTPGMIAAIGLNLVALNPVPSGLFSLTMDVVQNAPVPVLATDPVQIGREYLDGLLDYAQHIAVFKQGSQELIDTNVHYERLKRVAALQNERLRNSALFQDVPDDIARAKETPRQADGVIAGG